MRISDWSSDVCSSDLSIGMSLSVRKGKHYTEVNYDFMHKTMDISAISLHRVLQTALKKDALNEWGSVVALTYIAAQRVFPDYKIGRASCRERVCQYVYISVVAVSLKKKKRKKQ